MIFVPLSLLANSYLDCRYSATKQYSIPIIAWRYLPSKEYKCHKVMKDICDCGFNTVFYFNENLNADSICQIALRESLNVIMGSHALKTDRAETFISTLSNTDNILCWYLQDEPHFEDLPNLKKEYDHLMEFSQNKPIYVNLIGSISKKYTGDCKTMIEYLDTIDSLLHPEIWSYDYYPVSISNSKININYNQFFASLNAFKEQSQKTGKPYWAFCQGMEYKNSQIQRPAATLPFLRFEAFCALAFGAKGIVYWGYSLPKSNDEQYLSALTESNGKKTKAWYCSQKVNQEIRAFNDIFCHSKVNKIHINNHNLLFTHLNKEFESPLNNISLISVSGIGVLLSDISSDGKNFIIIINLDVENSQDIICNFNNDKEFYQLEYRNGFLHAKKIKSLKYSKSIPPGSYTILSY